MRKIKKGDLVVAIAGKDKGRQGTVLAVVNSGERVLVEGVNRVKKHTRGNPNAQIPGGIVEKESSLHISNVAIVNPATGKQDRIGFKILKDGRKVRFFKSTKEDVPEMAQEQGTV
jgi:large subunit ribosomal protein L24